MTAQAALQRLKALLSAEKDCLMSGRARDATVLVEDKLRAMNAVETALQGQPASAVPVSLQREIRAVAELAREIDAYFSAVRNGVRRAVDRLEGLSAEGRVGSYGPNGRQLVFSTTAGRYRNRV